MNYTFKAQCVFRIIRDDGIVSFSADLREPDRLQQAWVNMDSGAVEWRDVEVVLASKLIEEFKP